MKINCLICNAIVDCLVIGKKGAYSLKNKQGFSLIVCFNCFKKGSENFK